MKIPVLTFSLGLLAALPAWAADGAVLAADHGCLNCHGVRTHPHEAPLLKDMAAKLGRRGNESDAVGHALHEMREKNHVHGHVFISDEHATEILRWMARGAKLP
jgi:cytochrome c551/c552